MPLFLKLAGLIAIGICVPTAAFANCANNKLFRGGASLDNGLNFTNTVAANQTLFIGGELCPQSIHVGHTADIFVAFEIGDIVYLLNDNNELVEYTGSNPVSYRSGVTLPTNYTLELFSGVVGTEIAQVRLYTAYSINNEFYLDPQPQSFSVADYSTLSALQVSPQRDTTTANADDKIRITFDRPLDSSSIQNSDVKVFGRWTGVSVGSLALENSNQTLSFTPARSFAAGEIVSVSIPAQAISGLDGIPLEQGYSWSFWIETASAPLQFSQIDAVSVRVAGSTEQIQTYGAYAGDFNEDGWSDLVVPNEKSNDLRIFLNDGAGRYGNFTIVPIDGGDRPSPNEGADFDGDGDIDFVVGSAGGNLVHVFLGDGHGGLTQTQNLIVGERVRGVCLLDFENDGDPDIAATSFLDSQVSLFRNDGSGNFVNAGVMHAGEGEWSCAAADMNADGLVDLVVGTRTSDELIVLTSDGDGSFTLASRMPANGDPWMLAAGDIDRDGDIDIAASNASSQSLTVAMGTGTGSLLPAESYTLLDNGDAFPLAVDLGDLDGDGDLDIITSDYRTQLFLIHENQGDGKFLRLPNQLIAPEAASCVVLHDRDNDGDLDITGIDEISDLLLLFSH